MLVLEALTKLLPGLQPYYTCREIESFGDINFLHHQGRYGENLPFEQLSEDRI
jgi:hypothetical protein